MPTPGTSNSQSDTVDNPDISMLKLRPADTDDYDTIKLFFDEGRAFQRSLGFVQWKDNYPSRDVIFEDIRLKRGYVIEHDGIDIGYAVVDFSDSEYYRLNTIWRLQGDYAVVHRLVLGDCARGSGRGKGVIEAAEKIARSKGASIMRFDTGVHNLPMQNLLESMNYNNLGIFDFVWGPRYAYEKSLIQ